VLNKINFLPLHLEFLTFSDPTLSRIKVSFSASSLHLRTKILLHAKIRLMNSFVAVLFNHVHELLEYLVLEKYLI
jgi:hypothetical protein